MLILSFLNLFFILTTEHGDRIAGFLFEPIQGEAGVCFSCNYFVRFLGFLCLCLNDPLCSHLKMVFTHKHLGTLILHLCAIRNDDQILVLYICVSADF